MASVRADNICRTRRDARNQAFQRVQFVAPITTLVTFVVPCRMPVVTKDQLGAYAARFPCGTRCLYVAKVSQETDSTGQSFSQHRVLGTFGFQLDQVQRLLTRGQQPSKRIGQRKGHALSSALIQRPTVGVGRDPQVAISPQPQLHRSRESTCPRSRTVLSNPSHFGDPLLVLGEE